MRPAAQTASMRRMRVSPVAASTPTSANWAPNVCSAYRVTQVAVFHGVLGDQLGALCRVTQGNTAAPRAHLPVGELGFGRVEAETLRYGLPQLHARCVDARC